MRSDHPATDDDIVSGLIAHPEFIQFVDGNPGIGTGIRKFRRERSGEFCVENEMPAIPFIVVHLSDSIRMEFHPERALQALVEHRLWGRPVLAGLTEQFEMRTFPGIRAAEKDFPTSGMVEEPFGDVCVLHSDTIPYRCNPCPCKD